MEGEVADSGSIALNDACAVALMHRAKYWDNCLGDSACAAVYKGPEVPWKELLTRAEHSLLSCEAHSVISFNETLDDIETQSLVAAVLPYLIADLLANPQCELSDRVKYLKGSLEWHRRFLQRQLAWGLLPKNTLDFFLKDEESHDPGKLRAFKITNFRRQRELAQKVALLPALLSEPGNKILWEDRDEEARSCLTAWIEECGLASLRNWDTIQAEVKLLSSQENKEKEKEPPTGPVPKPFFYTISDPAAVRRAIKDKVFTPYHNLPTVSLAEVAKWEMEQDLRIGAASKTKKQSKSGNLRDSASTDSESSDEEKETAKRRWDDWKDENPRGSGNKNCNRG